MIGRAAIVFLASKDITLMGRLRLTHHASRTLKGGKSSMCWWLEAARRAIRFGAEPETEQPAVSFLSRRNGMCNTYIKPRLLTLHLTKHCGLISVHDLVMMDIAIMLLLSCAWTCVNSALSNRW